MILETLKDLASREGLLQDPDYEPKPVAWIISLAERGRFLGIAQTVAEEAGGKKPKAKRLSIPRRIGRTSGAVADFLVDKSEYILGKEPDGKRDEEALAVRAGLFRDSVAKASAQTGDVALNAVLAFLDDSTERSKAIGRVEAEGYKSNDLFAFQYDGELVHNRPAIREYFSRERRKTEGGKGKQCLVCGGNAIPVDKHPPVKVPGGTTSGAALVSFNSDAFESYGLERNDNAPVCRSCADGYTTALTRLLADGYIGPDGDPLPRRFVRISMDTTAVFWADRETEFINLLTSYFDAPQPESVAALFASVWKGLPTEVEFNRFYCLVLSGGKGRAVLRSMHSGSVEQVQAGIRLHFETIDVGSEQPMPLKSLLRGLVFKGDLERLPHGLATELFLSIVFGGKFPRTLLARAVARCCAEQKVTRERAAILRAYLIRNEEMEVTVGLDQENTSAGYRLGRLLAILERAQGAAQNNPNKTIVDRYYGAASTRPGVVFPRLVGLAQHHLAKLNEASAVFYRALIGNVMAGLTVFPATLNMQEQGLFAIGYYHQRQEFYKKRDIEVTGEAVRRGAEA